MATPEQIQAFKNRNQTMLRAGFGTTIATTAAVRNPYINGTPPASNDPPANAPAAPKGATKDVFTGLAEALNTNQQLLVTQGKYTYADEYVIKFNPSTLAASKLKRQGATDKNKIGMQNDNSAANQLNSEKQSADLNSRSLQVSAGMQIVQFIDMVMRNSTYITDQQTVIYNDGTQTLEANNNSKNGQTAWYKISVEATQLKYDPKRRDHAYRMTYMITPYAVNTMQSDYFPDSRYRGSHKRYNYWFTGANNEILNFEQDFNYLYRLIISGNAPKIQKSTSDFRGRDQYRKTYAPTSDENAKGADGYTNEPGDNAADFLYSPSDQAKIKLKIVGDPAWMQQGEVSSGLKNFNFNPFNSDGGINFDSQEVVFDVSWNRPADYNFDTGVMDVNQKSTKDGMPQENATYTAIKCRNTFSKGKFEQEVEGRLMIELDKGTQNAEGRSVAGTSATQTTTAAANTRTTSTISTTAGNWSDIDGGQVVTKNDVTPDDPGQQSDSDPQPINSPAPEAPTSNGDISAYGEQNELPNPSPASEATNTISPDYNAGLAGTTTGTTQLMDREA
jgi:hypothetical protein